MSWEKPDFWVPISAQTLEEKIQSLAANQFEAHTETSGEWTVYYFMAGPLNSHRHDFAASSGEQVFAVGE